MMSYVNAYNGSDFTQWYQGTHERNVSTIPETAIETLGKPEGSSKALEFFKKGADAVVESIRAAEAQGRTSYTYFYTAHPDKHMHALGVDHPEVRLVLEGIDAELERLWETLRQWDTTLLVTADHGHVTVEPDQMVTLPDEVLECLEYANVGVYGKGRHACLHCRRGRQGELEDRWAACPRLCDHFLLLTVEAAVEEGLFGPDPPRQEVRPRLGDYIVVALGHETLVSPDEASRWRDSPERAALGAHGSLMAEEMHIPFVLCTPMRAQL
jgi:hypothetical protein